MFFPLGHKYPRWKVSRTSIAKRHESGSRNHEEAAQGGKASVNEESERVEVHSPASEIIEDHFGSEDDYFSCDDGNGKDAEGKVGGL
ncbi:MAG: hypothetical protein Q9213_006241 [Squamulea squamosa]